MPSVGLAQLRTTIQAEYPNSNIEALRSLPESKSVSKTFSNKRKLANVENFDPLEPPSKLFVSFNYLSFNVEIFRHLH